MNNEKRLFTYSLAELIDRLTVDQIKEVLLPEKKADVAKEMINICHDVDLIIKEKNLVLDSRLIRIIIAISQLNLHIWKFKDEMESLKDKNEARYLELLKISHQLNGIRNRLKNMLLNQNKEADGASLRSNFNTDGLEGWEISI